MDNVCVRLGPALSKQVERDMKDFKYSTKTEFVREAIRDKLKANQMERAWCALFAARGSLKGKGVFKTAEDFHKWRSGEGSKEMLEFFEKKFGLNQK